MGNADSAVLEFEVVRSMTGPVMADDERLAFALEATRTGLWTVDGDDDTVRCDPIVARLIGVASDVALPIDEFMSLFDESSREVVRGLALAPERVMGDANELQLRLKRPEGTAERWVAARAKRSRTTGEIFGSLRDITDVKRDDAQVHMLMREVTHRSKNLLAIIQAMARQTVKDSLTAAEFEARFSARLRGLSCSHELLANQDWRGVSLTELARGHLGQLIEHHGARVQIAGPIVFIRPEAAQNIGLALNELGTNAQRYGALSGEQGTVRFEWHVDANEAGPQFLHLLWTEAGAVREVSPPSRQGFGHRVMERVVARALDAPVRMTFAPSGLQWSLELPLVHIASDASA